MPRVTPRVLPILPSRSDLSVIQIPRHFDHIRGSIICAAHGPIQFDRHFTAVLRLSTVDQLM